MNRIDKLFAEKNHNVLSVYYPAGYPHLDDTMMVLDELQAKGIDMVELGIPFSDPMADGEVIQQASTTALANGMTLKYLFTQIRNMRLTVSMPVILMGYLNPIMHYGFEKFCEDCQRVGVDGVIIPDLPFKEYLADFKEVADRHNVHVIMFISPETSDERVRLIDENTSGFIYMVSSAGTTGERSSFSGLNDGYFERINSMSLKNPRMIGFGISSPGTFRAACAASNGAIIGSHFVKLMKSESSPQAAITKLITDMGM